MRVLRIDGRSPYNTIVGVGGIGSGIFFALEGNHTLGRNESRAGALLPSRDYCKLHIVLHYVATLLGAGKSRVRVVPIGKVGDDENGHRLCQEMADAGMDVSCVGFVAGQPTLFSVCFQYPDGEGGNLTTNNSAASVLSHEEIDSCAAGLFAAAAKQTIALAVPEVPLEVRSHFLERATAAGAYRAASFLAGEIAGARDAGMLALLDLVSLNTSEAAELVGGHFSWTNSSEFVNACLRFLKGEFPRLSMIVTVGRHGAFAFAGQEYAHCPAPRVQVASTAGAGDALLGGVIAAIAGGVPLLKPGASMGPLASALDFGVLLASYKCQSPHTIHTSCSLEELVKFAGSKGWRFGATLQELMEI